MYEHIATEVNYWIGMNFISDSFWYELVPLVISTVLKYIDGTKEIWEPSF